MAGQIDSGDDELISGINVTPLVDVVLVLLIIFMITAPVIYQSAIKVQLPKARTGESTEKSPLSFAITQDGTVLWNHQAMDWKTLQEKLGALGPQAQSETALISADEKTPHGTVIRLMDSLRTVGLSRFALNVENRGENTSGK